MKMTIGDVARLAHVSPSTVSLVLNNKADGRIALENQKRVRAIIEKYNYKPSFSAQRLRQQNVPLVGLLMPAPGNDFGASMISNLQLMLQRRGCLSLFAFWDTLSTLQSKVLDSVQRYDVNGIIAWEMDSHLRMPDVPMVLFAQKRRGCNSVVIDYESAIRQALDYLTGLGHVNIGYAGADGDPRCRAFRKEMKERKLLQKQTWIYLTQEIQVNGISAMKDWLRLPKESRPTAVITHNDCLARAMCFLAMREGVNIPRELSIISFDDDRDSAITHPPLTTFRLPVETIANALIEQGLNKINYPDNPDTIVTITPELILRESCGPVRVSSGQKG